MSKRKLEGGEAGAAAKLLRPATALSHNLTPSYSNGDHTTAAPHCNGDAPFRREEEGGRGELELASLPIQINGDTLAPAKRISKRSVKKTGKVKRGKVLTEESETAELTEEESAIKSKRTWERWSKEEINIFFEGLSEYGKDFDKLEAHFKTKFKSKRNLPEHYIKTKNQIRHFYYRTWHKITGFINFNKDLKNNTKELHGLINYGELRKKFCGSVDEKFGAKLDDMVQKGTATFKIKGKTVRVKTPVCRALKKLNIKEEPPARAGGKAGRLPSKVVVELRPRATQDWVRVQRTAQNPHVRVNLAVSRRLASLARCLERKWRSREARVRNSIELPAEEAAPDGEERLLLLPPRGAAIRQPRLPVEQGGQGKRPRVRIKLAGLEAGSEVGSGNKFEEMLSQQRQQCSSAGTVDTEPCYVEPGPDENSNDGEGPHSSPKQEGEDRLYTMLEEEDDILPCNDDMDQEDLELQDLLEESDHECSRSPLPGDASGGDSDIENAEVIDENKEEEAEEFKEEESKPEMGEEESKPEVVEEDDKSEAETDGAGPTELSDPLHGWTRDTAGSLTIGELYWMLGGEDETRLRLDYSWQGGAGAGAGTEVTSMLTRLLRLAAGAGRAGGRGRTTSQGSGAGSPSVRGRLLLSPGCSAASRPVHDKPGSPLALPLLDSEHEFRKPLAPPPAARQGAMSAAFKEQIGQYLPKFSNRPGRQRRSRAKQVVGRQLLQPQPLQPRPLVQLLPLPPTVAVLQPAQTFSLVAGEDCTAPGSPPQISIPSPLRSPPSPTPSLSCLMDLTFESAPTTPTKPDSGQGGEGGSWLYGDGENSCLQTPPRPAPTPSPSRCLQDSQDISLSSWSLTFDSPVKSISIPLPFNEDSQNSTISTSSEVKRAKKQ